jgi:hypothetical protein
MPLLALMSHNLNFKFHKLKATRAVNLLVGAASTLIKCMLRKGVKNSFALWSLTSSRKQPKSDQYRKSFDQKTAAIKEQAVDFTPKTFVIQ